MAFIVAVYSLVFVALLFSVELSASRSAPLFLLLPLLHPSIRLQGIETLKSKSPLFTIALLGSALVLVSPWSDAPGTAWLAWIMHLFWVVIPEEFFFRVFYFRTLEYENSGNVPAARWLVLNALYFCFFHVLTGVSLENLLIFFPGLLLAWTYYKTRDLPLVCCLHLVLNALYFRILSVFPLLFNP